MALNVTDETSISVEEMRSAVPAVVTFLTNELTISLSYLFLHLALAFSAILPDFADALTHTPQVHALAFLALGFALALGLSLVTMRHS